MRVFDLSKEKTIENTIHRGWVVNVVVFSVFRTSDNSCYVFKLFLLSIFRVFAFFKETTSASSKYTYLTVKIVFFVFCLLTILLTCWCHIKLVHACFYVCYIKHTILHVNFTIEHHLLFFFTIITKNNIYIPKYLKKLFFSNWWNFFS